MFQEILVPLDGSTHAERAIAVAARLARASGGRVVLLRVVGPTWEFSPSQAPALPSASAQMLLEGEQSEASSSLARLAASQELVGVQVVTEVLAGSAATAILEVAQGRECDLIVLCRHGYTASTRWTVGGIAEKIARHATIPVLLLNEAGPSLVRSDRDTERPMRVLVPLDGSPQAEAALLPALALIRALATSVCRAACSS
jgi:nucleotide-binding universal stress UspA family protein